MKSIENFLHHLNEDLILSENKFRSVNGGSIATCDEYCTDTLYRDGYTHYNDCGGSCNKDTNFS